MTEPNYENIDEAIDTINLHLEETPVYQELPIEAGDVTSREDLNTLFDYLNDSDLQNIDPKKWVPESYKDEHLTLSESSGTTGDRKKIYWHKKDIEENIDYVSEVFKSQESLPTNADWTGTVTHNEVLEKFLYGLSEEFNGSMNLTEVNPAPVKKALLSGNEKKKEEIMDPIVKPIVEDFRENNVKVYEDIPPLMLYTASKLSREERENVEALLIGGVGTSRDAINQLNETYTNADILGWYGDYMNGLNPMNNSEDLEYTPNNPQTVFDVRKLDDIQEPVEIGEEGEVVSYSIKNGHFVPNRRTGDKGIKTENGIKQISRLGE